MREAGVQKEFFREKLNGSLPKGSFDKQVRIDLLKFGMFCPIACELITLQNY